MKNEKNSALKIISISKKLKNLGFLAGFSGNISIRTGPNEMLITPKGKDKGELKIADISKIRLDGKLLKGPIPSSEYKLHSALYEQRKNIDSIIHTHPPFSSVFACSNIKINKPLLAEFVLVLKGLPKTPYFTPGSTEAKKAVKNLPQNINAAILENHGLVCFAKTIENAFNITEEAEHFAKVYFLSLLLKKQKNIPAKKLPELEKLAKTLSF